MAEEIEIPCENGGKYLVEPSTLEVEYAGKAGKKIELSKAGENMGGYQLEGRMWEYNDKKLRVMCEVVKGDSLRIVFTALTMMNLR